MSFEKHHEAGLVAAWLMNALLCPAKLRKRLVNMVLCEAVLVNRTSVLQKCSRQVDRMVLPLHFVELGNNPCGCRMPLQGLVAAILEINCIG